MAYRLAINHNLTSLHAKSIAQGEVKDKEVTTMEETTEKAEMTRAEKLEYVKNVIEAQSDEETESTLLAVRFLEAGYALGKAAERAS